MTITIITVGSVPKHEIASLIESFTKRLPKHVTCTWRYLKSAGSVDPATSITIESENILNAIPKNNKVVLLDESGQTLTSEKFSDEIFSRGQNTAIIIGGAHGVNDTLKQRADIIVSFGRMVFPHQLVRLMLAEQLYRAHAIHTGHPYHHT